MIYYLRFHQWHWLFRLSLTFIFDFFFPIDFCLRTLCTTQTIPHSRLSSSRPFYLSSLGSPIQVTLRYNRLEWIIISWKSHYSLVWHVCVCELSQWLWPSWSEDLVYYFVFGLQMSDLLTGCVNVRYIRTLFLVNPSSHGSEMICYTDKVGISFFTFGVLTHHRHPDIIKCPSPFSLWLIESATSSLLVGLSWIEYRRLDVGLVWFLILGDLGVYFLGI